jgi:hypothetical protein
MRDKKVGLRLSIISALSFIFILLILDSYLLWKNRIIKTEQLQKDFLIEYLSKRNEQFENKLKIEIQSEFTKISPDQELIDFNEDTLSIESLFSHPVLIFRYSALQCNSCIDLEKSLIDSLFKQNSQIEPYISYFVFYSNRREYIADIRESKNNIPYFQVPDNSLGLQIDKYNMPYYFVLNQGLSISDVFIPEKENLELSKIYLENVIKRITAN